MYPPAAAAVQALVALTLAAVLLTLAWCLYRTCALGLTLASPLRRVRNRHLERGD